MDENFAIVRGFVDHITYHNEENGYTVFLFFPDAGELSDDYTDGITCTGAFVELLPGESLELKGHLVLDPTYGMQFRCDSYEFIKPSTATEIERYLAGGAVKGIGSHIQIVLSDAQGHIDGFEQQIDDLQYAQEHRGQAEQRHMLGTQLALGRAHKLCPAGEGGAGRGVLRAAPDAGANLFPGGLLCGRRAADVAEACARSKGIAAVFAGHVSAPLPSLFLQTGSQLPVGFPAEDYYPGTKRVNFVTKRL